MAFTIVSKNGEKTFTDKELVNICSRDGYDYKIDVDFECMLTVQYDAKSNKCVILNQFNNPKFMFKGKSIPQKLEVEKVCKLMIDGSDEFITIKMIGESFSSKVQPEQLSEDDVKCFYGNEVNAQAKLKIEKRKAELENARISIVKEISFVLNDLKHKKTSNSKVSVFLHFALLAASLLCAFGVSNYLTGLPLKDAGSVIQMPTNMKLIVLYTLMIYGVGLILKQGIFLYLQNKLGKDNSVSKIAESFMLVISILFYIGIYFVNVVYYIAPQTFPIFAVLISLLFVSTSIVLSISCGYFKHANTEISEELDTYEYRSDFETVIKEYQQWIERFVNSLSHTKIQNIKDRLFSRQIKSIGEIALGICTAPFLAYGVSNTLAMCFPEAAGWVRISGLRFSPVFLVLATFMIIFAFFAFVNAFLCIKKIQASNVLKNDGFSNYLQHGVEIFGCEGIRKLQTDMKRSFYIGLAVIFIEFSMNISFFMQEMGGDLGGMFLSSVAALVPTALLIAETYMLSQTKFDIFACEEIIEKFDRD